MALVGKDEGDSSEHTRIRPALSVEAGGRDRAYLIVLAGTGRGKMFKLESGDSIIGRSPRAAIRLVEEGVSREHAVVKLEQDDVVLEDLGSTNGTFCNGERVTRHTLADGDKIMIGATTILKFTYHDNLDEQFQQKMYESALRDGLTKLFNRRHFDDMLAKEFAFATRHGVPLALLFIDIDHFKKVNDVFGHPAGDFVLGEVSSALTSACRTEDMIARFGGEEFCVLCRGTDLNGARELGERLRREIEERRQVYGNKVIQVTISVGVAALPDPAMLQATMLLTAADKALYDAKRAGRNRVVTAAPGIP